MISQSRALALVCWSGVGVAAAAFVAFGYATEVDRRQHAIRPEDGCLAYAPPPAITMVLNDQTDPLAGDQPRRWRANLDEEVSRLSSGAVLFIGAIGPAAPTEMTSGKLCIPLASRGGRASELRQKFNDRLTQVGTALEQSPSTPRSAISATIATAAGDVGFIGKTTGPRRLVVNSDLLEHDVASAYRPGGLDLPPLPRDALKGVTVRFNVLRNERDYRLQSRALIDAWTTWARNGGATSVEVNAPWLGFRMPPPVGANTP